MLDHQGRSFRWHWLVVVGVALAMMSVATLGSVARGQDDPAELTGNQRTAYELIVSWSPSHPDDPRTLHAVPIDGSQPYRLIPGTPDDTFESYPDVAPDGRVVFVSGPEGNSDLFVWDGSGAARNLTRSPWNEYDPVWSPDGTQIAFGSRDDDRDIAQVFVIDAAGTNKRQLTDRGGGAVSPAWSPDGTRIAFTSIGGQQRVDNGWQANTQLWIMDADGSNEQQITTVGPPGVASFEWSPDGQSLIVSGAKTQIVSMDGRAAVELAPEMSILGSASWSPDGAVIAVVAPVGDDSRGPTALLLVDRDGTTVRELARSDATIWGLSWSPDSRWIAFVHGDVPPFESGPPPPPVADWSVSIVSREGASERMVLDGVYRGEQMTWQRSSPPE